MKRSSAALFLLVLTGFSSAQEAKTPEIAATEARLSMKFPDRGQVELKIEGVAVKLPERGTGTQLYTVKDLDAKKEYVYKIEAVLVPNNYTRIIRVREVTFKPGTETKVDFTVEDRKTDKIVVRWVPTPNDIVDEMSKMAKIGKDDVVYDPGCGDAVMLIRPIKLFGAKRGIGIDIDEKMVKIALAKAEEEGVSKRVEIRKGDILDVKEVDLSEITVVLLYIGEDLNIRLKPILKKGLKPGTRIISHRFTMGDDWKPETSKTVKGMDGEEYELYMWTIPQPK